MAAEDLAAVAAEEAGAAADPAEDLAAADRRWEDGRLGAVRDRRVVQDFSGDLGGASARGIAAAVFPLLWCLP